MFQSYVITQFNAKIKAIQSDFGGEFRTFTKLLNEQGILHRLTCSHTCHQNGTVERKHKQIVDMCLSLLVHAFMPINFWDHRFTTAVYLINKLPISAYQDYN